MSLWTEAFDELNAIPEKNVSSTDQRLKRAEVKALLAIGQQLSLIQAQGVKRDSGA